MRLLKLRIDNHLLLRDLQLPFDREGRFDIGDYALDFLVGVNGSGKSTVLRALTKILVNLQAGIPIEFNFLLNYRLTRGDSVFEISIQQIVYQCKNWWHQLTVCLLIIVALYQQ